MRASLRRSVHAPRANAPRANAALGLALVASTALLASGCGYASYSIRRTAVDSPIPFEAAEQLEPGRTTFAEAVEHLGPPDALTRGRDAGGAFVVRADWVYRKGRGSDLRVSVPERNIVSYNTGLGWFLLFLRVMRSGGTGSVVPEPVRDLVGGSGFPPTSTSAPRIRDVRDSAGATSDGRVRRLDDVRLVAGSASDTNGEGSANGGAFDDDDESEEGDDSSFRPFSLFTVDTADDGTDRIRLEFDARGRLVRRSVRCATPATDLEGQTIDGVIP